MFTARRLRTATAASAGASTPGSPAVGPNGAGPVQHTDAVKYSIKRRLDHLRHTASRKQAMHADKRSRFEFRGQVPAAHQQGLTPIPRFVSANTTKRKVMVRILQHVHSMADRAARRRITPLQLWVSGPVGCGKTHFCRAIKEMVEGVQKTSGRHNLSILDHEETCVAAASNARLGPGSLYVIDDCDLLPDKDRVVDKFRRAIMPRARGAAAKKMSRFELMRGCASAIVFTGPPHTLPRSLAFVKTMTHVALPAPTPSEVSAFADRLCKPPNNVDTGTRMIAQFQCNGDLRQLKLRLRFGMNSATSAVDPEQ